MFVLRRSIFPVSLGLAVVVCAALTRDGLAATATPALPDLTSFQLMRTDPGAATAVSVDSAADALKDYDVVFMGEWHDHTGNHLAEMALFRALYARNPQLALSMEMFERDVQPVL